MTWADFGKQRIEDPGHITHHTYITHTTHTRRHPRGFFLHWHGVQGKNGEEIFPPFPKGLSEGWKSRGVKDGGLKKKRKEAEREKA